MLNDLIDIRDALVNAAGLQVRNEFDRGYQQGVRCALNKVQALVLSKFQSKSVFAFEFCFCKFESGFSVKSIHSTKASAYRAMMKHKCEHWHEMRSYGINPSEIGLAELWRVKEYKLMEGNDAVSTVRRENESLD